MRAAPSAGETARRGRTTKYGRDTGPKTRSTRPRNPPL